MASLYGAVRRQNGRKVLWTSISVTTSAALYALPATCTEDGRTVPDGATLMIQPLSGSINYRLAKAGATAGATATNCTYVPQFGQEYTERERLDTQLDMIGGTAGTVLVFLVTPGSV